jgi:DNA mismatch repair protein MutS
LEQRSAASQSNKTQQELLLISSAETERSLVLDALEQLEPDSMTPRDALDALYKLKKLHLS